MFWRFLNRIEERTLRWNDYGSYVIITVASFFPIVLSWYLGMNHTLRTSELYNEGKHSVCVGYWDRTNWTSLVVLLPLALLVVRWTGNRLYPLGVWPELYRISNRVQNKERAERTIRDAAVDGRNFAVALLITVLIHVVDLFVIAKYYFNSFRGFSLAPPVQWDWALWYLNDPSNRTLMYKNVVLVFVAYSVQFLTVLLAIELITLLVRHNLVYLRLIYLRNRAQGMNPADFIVLDFGAQDRSFGLRRLSAQFNLQILLLAVAGGFTLISRVVDSDTSKVLMFLGTQPPDSPGKTAWALLVAIFSNARQLFPTYGQAMFLIGWLIMFVIVMMPAQAKLLPLSVLPTTYDGAADYLLQFIPPGSPLDVTTQSLSKPGSVDETAAQFAKHSFWPVGDRNAQYVSLMAFLVFFFMLAPVLPLHSLGPGIFLYYLSLLIISYACSRLLFWLFAYRLGAVDPRLVG
jgi:hypothetical protein